MELPPMAVEDLMEVACFKTKLAEWLLHANERAQTDNAPFHHDSAFGPRTFASGLLTTNGRTTRHRTYDAKVMSDACISV